MAYFPSSFTNCSQTLSLAGSSRACLTGLTGFRGCNGAGLCWMFGFTLNGGKRLSHGPNILVYVIGLNAVQFGNNWMRKIPRTAKLDEAVGRVQFGSPRNFLNPIISKLDKHVVLLPINYIVYYLRVKNNADFVRNILFQNIFGIQINS